MSTNALIAFQNLDESVHAAYVHYDGRVENIVPILVEHFNSEALAHDLVHRGDMVSLKPDVNVINFYNQGPARLVNGPEFAMKRGMRGLNKFIWKDGQWHVGRYTLDVWFTEAYGQTFQEWKSSDMWRQNVK